MVIRAGSVRANPTCSFNILYSTRAITESSRLSAEIDRRIGAGWMSFNRYRVELYDRPTASLDLKTQMVKSEVVEAPLYGCAAWTPLKGDYQKLRTAHHRMLPRILGAWCRSKDHRILSYHLALQRTGCESIETTVRTRRLLWAGELIRMDNRRLPRRIMVGTLENPGRRGRGRKEKEWTGCVADDLRLFGTGDGEGWKTVALYPASGGKW